MTHGLSRTGERPRLIGVVHLLPLPGAPTVWRPLEQTIERAIADAMVLQEGGADGLIVENLGDSPFTGTAVEPWTIASMTAVLLAVRSAVPSMQIGVNVLRNDARGALGIAAVTGADFIRVNVHTGVMVTDQGVLTGQARNTLLARTRLKAKTLIAADILVKHATPLGNPTLEDVARDTWRRGHADAIIVTGQGTGQPTAPDDLQRVRTAVPDAILWCGSGLDPSRMTEIREVIDGAIVGTWLHEQADLRRPLDLQRVKDMANACQG